MNLRLIILLSLCPLLMFSQAKPGIQLSYMDRNIDPGEDFYHFCNGKWEKEFRLPPSDARYGSFNEIRDRNLQKIKILLDEFSNSKTAPPGSDIQRLRDFYLSGMDSASLDEQKTDLLQPLLRRIDTLESADEFMALKSDLDAIGVPLFFKVNVAPDLKNSRKNILYFSQGAYGMGDRDFYHNPQHKKTSEAYIDYLHYLFVANGYQSKDSRDAAEEVFYFETALSNEALSRQELRETEKIYNPHTPDQLKTLMPALNWNLYFSRQGLAWPDTVVLSSVPYFNRVNKILELTPVQVIRMYAKAQLIQAAAPYQSTKLQFTEFEFREKVMSGTQAIKPRWERVFRAMDACMGELFSKEYVKRYFSAESKQKVNKMVDHLVLAYRERLMSRDWMSAGAKAMAGKKLSSMIRKIGYPEQWKSYKGLMIKSKSYWENVCAARAFEYREMLSELKKPVNRMKWQMTPVTVNAYYDPSTNEITFPAGILQPPFFDPKADDAVNYGTMGAIIGHELTHGFDDEGSKFDANGNFKSWWAESDLANFKLRSEQLVKQYTEYKLLDSLAVNGKMTLGENIADLGGVTLAFHAYRKSLNGGKSPLLDGFTGEQRFFIAWAQGWKSKIRDEELKRLLRQDYHAPAKIRAYAPLTNLEDFHKAFGISEGKKMFRPVNERVEIW